MTEQTWTAIDDYFADLLLDTDDGLEAALAASDAAGLPPIQVSPSQGKFLHLLARLRGARSILEIGTLGGYSTIWLGRALPPDGRLITLESLARHAEAARANIRRAGLAGAVEVRVGPALDILPRLAEDGDGPFDLVFIDADKQRYPEYFSWAVGLSAPGGVIVADNVVRGGRVADADSDDPRVQGVRRMVDLVARDRRVTATAVQTVGAKGYDGLLLALVTDDR